MGQKSITFCDVCFVEKKAVNHWYVVRITNMFTAAKAEEVSLNHPFLIDVCGQACLTVLLQKWMRETKIKETVDGQERKEG